MDNVEKPEELAAQRVRLMTVLEKYVSPSAVDKIMNMEPGDTSYLSTEMMHFQFVLVHVRENDSEETTRTIAKLVDTIKDSGAIMGNITCSLIDAYFGFPRPECDSAELRQKLVAALIADHGDRVRVVHGQCNGLVGNFGSRKRCSYGALIPNFSDILKTLLALEFGSAIEVIC